MAHFCLQVLVFLLVGSIFAAADDIVLRMEVSPEDFRGISALYDVWHVEVTGHGTYQVDAMMPGNSSRRFPDATVVVPSVSAFLRAEAEQREARLKAVPRWTVARGDDSFFDAFRPHEEHDSFVSELAAAYPDIVQELEAIGNTVEGARIRTFRLKSPRSSSASENNKTALYLQSTVHAREWIATTSLAWAMKSLCEGYGYNDTITAILDEIDVYVTPIVNIDGYKFTWTSNRMWRKNRRDHGNGRDFGTDINRNWGPADTWCSTGSSTNPSSDTYCGTAPFSEPETAAAASFIDAHPSISGVIDFHTVGPLILWPWQYTYNRVPEPGYTMLEELGADVESAINAQARPRYNYVSQQGSDLYPHSGGIIDYVWTELEVPAFTFEGRGQGFVTPVSDIVPAGVEQFDGVIALANFIKDENRN